MEIKLSKEELEYIPDGSMDYILDKKEVYVDHYPELANMRCKNILFYIVRTKNEVFYLASIKRDAGNISPKIIKTYSGNSRKREYCTGVILKFNRMYHIVAGMYILV